MTALEAASTDVHTWSHPEQFLPERFLDEEGKLCLEKDHSLIFAAGKRQCAGETFARNMLFLLTTCLFQNFTVSAPIGKRIPMMEENATGFVKLPPDFWAQLDPR